MTRRRKASRPPLAAVPAPVLVLGGVVGLEGGAAIATTVIPRAGIAGTVSLRLGFGALGLLALARPRLRSLDRRTVLLVVMVGSVLAAHHLLFYEAIHRLPLGVAVTLEFVGPLTVALLGSSRRIDVLWAALAAIGVAGAAGIAAIGHIDVAGVAFGLGAGACWAGYIAVFPVLAARAGRSDGLALSTAWAAVAIVPYAVVTGHDRIFTTHALLFGAVVALLSDVVAYTLQSEALGRIPRSLFSILTSTEPAVGALLGLIALGQHIALQQWAGMLAVVVASIGATRSHRRTPAVGPAVVSARSRPHIHSRPGGGMMVDRLFSEPGLAELYDLFFPFDGRGDFAFYLPLVLSAAAVLDVGCGTGALLRRAREAGHTGRLCGLDPAGAMLEQARTRPDIEWILGDLASAAWDQEFDLVVMTGHAFQVLTADDEIRAALGTIRSALTQDGRFAFETRNPLAREWESWTPDHAVEVAGAGGAMLRMSHEVERPVDGDLVSFTTTFTSPGWDRPQLSRSTLRFLDSDSLPAFLADAGLAIEEQFGDWDRHPLTDASPEIITIATRG